MCVWGGGGCSFLYYGVTITAIDASFWGLLECVIYLSMSDFSTEGFC